MLIFCCSMAKSGIDKIKYSTLEKILNLKIVLPVSGLVMKAFTVNRFNSCYKKKKKIRKYLAKTKAKFKVNTTFNKHFFFLCKS